MLTDAQVDELRTKVRAYRPRFQGPAQRPVRIRFRQGPLDGIGVTVDADAAGSEFFGWCATTPGGAVQVLYRRSPAGEWLFDRCDDGVR